MAVSLNQHHAPCPAPCTNTKCFMVPLDWLLFTVVVVLRANIDLKGSSVKESEMHVVCEKVVVSWRNISANA